MAEKDPRIIGARIAKLRQAMDLTQAQLAAGLGVAESTVANWERGIAYPKRKLGKLEKFFGQRIDYDHDDNGGGGPARPPSVTTAEALARAEQALATLREAYAQEQNRRTDEGNARRAAG